MNSHLNVRKGLQSVQYQRRYMTLVIDSVVNLLGPELFF
jgi:hypothetical protein